MRRRPRSTLKPISSPPTIRPSRSRLRLGVPPRGVSVNVLTDWVGTGNAQAQALQHDFAALGVTHRSFNPWFVRGIARMHRKLCVVDRQVAFLGGLNVVDDLHDDDDATIGLP